jgi:hypothetical protein
VPKRSRAGTARARDFLDIQTLITHYSLVMTSPENLELVKLVFKAKRVPLELLAKIKDYREFHQPDFQSVKDTVKPGVSLEAFDYYFDYVVRLADQLLKALGNV